MSAYKSTTDRILLLRNIKPSKKDAHRFDLLNHSWFSGTLSLNSQWTPLKCPIMHEVQSYHCLTEIFNPFETVPVLEENARGFVIESGWEYPRTKNRVWNFRL